MEKRCWAKLPCHLNLHRKTALGKWFSILVISISNSLTELFTTHRTYRQISFTSFVKIAELHSTMSSIFLFFFLCRCLETHIWNKCIIFFKYASEEYNRKITAHKNVCTTSFSLLYLKRYQEKKLPLFSKCTTWTRRLHVQLVQLTAWEPFTA